MAAIVEGPAGIGKTRRLAAAQDSAEDLEVLHARASELERDFPFGVVRQLFEPVLFAADEKERSPLFAGAGGLAERVLAASPVTDGGAAGGAFAVLHGLYWFADARDPSRRVERHRRRAAGRACPGKRTGLAVPELCRQATGGNPFLVGELLGELAEQGVTPTVDYASRVEGLSSSRVGRAVRARLRRLPPSCLELARAVSVLDEGCELADAARLAKLDEQTATRAADALVASAILEPSRPLAFVHPLVRASVHEELRAGERSDWHVRAARALAVAGAAPDRVAVHLLASEPRGDADAVETLRRAAASASARGASDVSVTYLRRALAEPAPEELKPVLAHELGAAGLRAGALEVAIEQLRVAVRELPEAGRRARAADELASAPILVQRAEEAVVELSEVIAELPADHREDGLRLQATRLAAALSSIEAWRRLRASENRFFVEGSQPGTTGERLQLVETALNAAREGTAESTRRLALGALGHGELLDDPGAESAAFWGLPVALLMAHAFEEAAQVCTKAIEWARRHGSQPAFALHAQFRAFASTKLGSLVDAEADAVSGLQQTAIPRPVGLAALGVVLVERGRVGEAEQLLIQEHFEHRSVRVPWFLEARARVHAASGRLDAALEDLFECGRIEEDWEVRTPAFSTWRAHEAPLLASLDRRDEAMQLVHEELERCRAFAAPGPLGAVLRTLGTLEGGEAGLARLNEAVDVLQASPTRLEYAQARLEQGAALRRAGRRTAARESLRNALEHAVACGAHVLAARAHDELVAAGARSRRNPSGAALAADAIDLLDALGLDRVAVVGHDWGARVAYTLAAVAPERVTAIVALALPYQPRGAFTIPPFHQARAFWYQWLMCLDAGARAVAADPIAFARIQWDTWSPPRWFDDDEFHATARSFTNPD